MWMKREHALAHTRMHIYEKKNRTNEKIKERNGKSRKHQQQAQRQQQQPSSGNINLETI